MNLVNLGNTTMILLILKKDNTTMNSLKYNKHYEYAKPLMNFRNIGNTTINSPKIEQDDNEFTWHRSQYI